MNNNKFAYILEIVWAVITLGTLGISLHSTFTDGFKKSIGLYLLTLVAFLFYFIRRYRRVYRKNGNFGSS